MFGFKKENQGRTLKAIMFLMISAVFALGSFFLEQIFASSDEAETTVFEAFDYEKENILEENIVFRFGEGENELNLIDNEAYLIDVAEADFWANFSISNKKANLVVGKLVLIPNQASFSLRFDGSDVNLAVYDGDVYVGILPEELKFSDFQDAYSEMFMNRLLVPRETQITINVKRIDERMGQLLNSKLVKEFKHSVISAAERESGWVTENLKKDRKFIESVKQKFTAEILSRGVVNGGNSAFGSALFWARENLTFMPEKKKEIVFAHLFGFLDDAMIYAAKGEDFKPDLEKFFAYLARLDREFSTSEEFFALYDDYIRKLSVFEAEDKEYGILMALLDKKFLDKRDVYEIVNTFWLSVYDGLKVNSASAEQALDRYYKYFDLTLGDIGDREFYLNYITYQNQLFDNLLLRYPVFYKKGYFAIKNAVEQTLLGLYDEGGLKNELRQALISTKIDFLKRLMRFFFEGEVNIQQAKEILSLLVEEIDQIMPADSAEVAVTEVFQVELQEIANFWGYLNTPEYNSSKTYGLTHKDRYETYLVEKDRIWNFITVQEDILGEEGGVEMSSEDIRKEVFAAFSGDLGFSDVRVGEVTLADQRYVDVAAVISGYPFKALFDRDQVTVKDIYVYEQLISDRAVRLPDLLSLVKSEFADFAGEVAESEDLSEESFAERAARVFVAKKISEAGFLVSFEDVAVVDESLAIYRVDKVPFGDDKDVLVSFDFEMNGEMAKNVYLSLKGTPVVMDGEYTLEELVGIVLAEGDFSGGVLR